MVYNTSLHDPSICMTIFQDAALASLKSLNRNDVVEVRALMRPPDGVRMVIEAVCIMKSVKAKKVAGDKVSIYFFHIDLL